MKFIKALLWLIIALVLAFAVLLLTATLSDYKPDEQTLLGEDHEAARLKVSNEYNVMIWNIGYCGLDEGMDFFYDGGKLVRPENEQVLKNLDAVKGFISKQDSVDFILLQEVDIQSRRSYYTNQQDSLRNLKPDFASFSATNYKVFFVPLPIKKPMGKVYSGLFSLNRYSPEKAVRYDFPGQYAWPVSLFMLDRCFLVTRFPLENGSELVVINTHNSAYDNGSLKKLEMDYFRAFVLEEYENGNYVVAGGDWNQSPPGFEGEFDHHVFDSENFSKINDDFLPSGWKWVWDPAIPTNRRVGTVYIRGESPTALIDYFLVSPNIKDLNIKCIDLDFQNSDHQPVILKFTINQKN